MKMLSHPLYVLLFDLDQKNISYSLSRDQPDSISVAVCFVGSRLEIGVFDDGHMEVAIFEGTEAIVGGREIIDKFLEQV